MLALELSQPLVRPSPDYPQHHQSHRPLPHPDPDFYPLYPPDLEPLHRPSYPHHALAFASHTSAPPPPITRTLLPPSMTRSASSAISPTAPHGGSLGMSLSPSATSPRNRLGSRNGATLATTLTSGGPAPAAIPPPLDPPFRGYIDTTLDALLVFEAARRGMIPRVTRRLIEKERGMIQSGAVFVFDEHESGIKRWTDGLIWSPSRILNNFLVYRQQDKRQGNNNSSNSERRDSASSAISLASASNSKHAVPQYLYDEYGAPIALASAAMIIPASRPQLSAASVSGLDVLSRPRSASESGEKAGGKVSMSTMFTESGLVKKTMSVNVNGYAQHLVSYYKVSEVDAGRLKRPSNIPDLAGLEISPEYLKKQNFRFPPLIELGPDGVERYKGETADPATSISTLSTSSTTPGPGPSQTLVYPSHQQNGSFEVMVHQQGVSPGSYSRPSTSTSDANLITPITPAGYYAVPSGSYFEQQQQHFQSGQVHSQAGDISASASASMTPKPYSSGKMTMAHPMIRQVSEGTGRDFRSRASRRFDPYGQQTQLHHHHSPYPPHQQHQPSPMSASMTYQSCHQPSSPDTLVTDDFQQHQHQHQQSHSMPYHPPSSYMMSIETGGAIPVAVPSFTSSRDAFNSLIGSHDLVSDSFGTAIHYNNDSAHAHFVPGEGLHTITGSQPMNMSLSSPYPMDVNRSTYQTPGTNHPDEWPSSPASTVVQQSQSHSQHQGRDQRMRPHTAVPLSLDMAKGYDLGGSNDTSGFHSAAAGIYDNSMQVQQQAALVQNTHHVSQRMTASASHPGSGRASPVQLYQSAPMQITPSISGLDASSGHHHANGMMLQQSQDTGNYQVY